MDQHLNNTIAYFEGDPGVHEEPECTHSSVEAAADEWRTRHNNIMPYQGDAPTCPACGSRLDVLLAGNRCPDTQRCGYHSHTTKGL